MLGGGGVEAIVELHRTPDTKVAVALENGLHALPAIHLTRFLVVHSRCKGTGVGVMWGLGLRASSVLEFVPVGAVAGTHEKNGQCYGI